MPLYTDLSAQQARDQKAHFRDFEKRKYEEVYQALVDAIADCGGNLEKLTQDAVREKMPGKSPGTVKKYLRFAWAIWKDEFDAKESGSGEDDPWPALTAGARKLFQAVSDFVDSMKTERSRFEGELHAQLASAVAGQEVHLRDQTQRCIEAEQAVMAVAAESDERAAHIELLEEKIAALLAADEAHTSQLATLQRDLEVTTAKLSAAEADAASGRRTEADLRGDLGAARLELSAERQRSAEVVAAMEEAIRVREGESTRLRAELDQVHQQHREEMNELRRLCSDELAAMRAAHAREIDLERHRNAELALAVAEALKNVAKPVEEKLS